MTYVILHEAIDAVLVPVVTRRGKRVSPTTNGPARARFLPTNVMVMLLSNPAIAELSKFQYSRGVKKEEETDLFS